MVEFVGGGHYLAGKARREKIHPEEILFGVYRCANDWSEFYKTSSGEIGL